MPIHSFNRRSLIGGSLGTAAAIGIDARLPSFLANAADTARTGENVLVVVQLTGGNDGLNTLIPFTDTAYYTARPELGIAASDVLKLDDALGLHPKLRGIADLFEAGNVSVVQGVGYDSPNRSHFESMDIWHSCRRKTEDRDDGWLGRCIEDFGPSAGGDVPALHLGGNQQPTALASRSVRVPSLKSLDEFQLRGKNREQLRELISGAATANSAQANDLLGFVQSSSTAAIIASQRVSEAAGQYATDIQYPASELGTKLRTVAQLIDSGITTRIYYVELDGFDTHAKQAEPHANLLAAWSESVAAFLADVKQHGHDQRVCVMTFSEFGRRVAENASGGTDHGAAAPMFLCGSPIQGGVLGELPDLNDLEDGDLKHQIDFRQVYAGVLRDWLQVDERKVLGNSYEPLKLFG